ncbi:MAG: SDR family NAD(P)-dependent oxidoreductase [Anaerolineales bacterium]
MKTTGNTILITGGATGIGAAMVEVFLREGNRVIICGRRKENLLLAQSKFPQVQFKVCDVAKEEERKTLYEWAISNYPELNVLVNNAGIQRQVDFTKGTSDLVNGDDEIQINFSAPVLLSALFIPHLMELEESAVVNISSGLGFVPLTIVPVYCATKAAIHSFSWSLRHQLRKSHIKVFEVIPPTVDTELDRGERGRRNQEYRGVPAAEVAEATLLGLANDDYEIAIGQAQGLRGGTRQETEQIFQRMNGHW